jgi:hypothetical protein
VTLSPDEQKRFAELSGRRTQLTADEADEWRLLRTAAIPKMIEPYYSLADPAVIPLYAGPLLYPLQPGKAAEQSDGTVTRKHSGTCVTPV